LRDRQKEYDRRKVQALIVMAQQPFQLKQPKTLDRRWTWPGVIPPEVVFDPVSTVSATYGVALQTQFRAGQCAWSSRPAIFVIDQNGVLRYSDGRYSDGRRDQDIREAEFFPILDELDEQRRLITALGTQEKRREAVRIALAPLNPRSKAAIPALSRALKDESAQVRAGAAVALYWLAPQAGAASPALGTALQDSDSRVRRFSALALARIGPKARAAVAALLKALKDDDPKVRAAVAEALKQIAPEAAKKAGQ
jgi:hypothetical protein